MRAKIGCRPNFESDCDSTVPRHAYSNEPTMRAMTPTLVSLSSVTLSQAVILFQHNEKCVIFTHAGTCIGSIIGTLTFLLEAFFGHTSLCRPDSVQGYI
jgi:hypothetical protein